MSKKPSEAVRKKARRYINRLPFGAPLLWQTVQDAYAAGWRAAQRDAREEARRFREKAKAEIRKAVLAAARGEGKR